MKSESVLLRGMNGTALYLTLIHICAAKAKAEAAKQAAEAKAAEDK